MLISFVMLVHGLAWSDRMRDQICSCEAQSPKTNCQIRDFPLESKSSQGHRMILLVDQKSQPAVGKVKVFCKPPSGK